MPGGQAGRDSGNLWRQVGQYTGLAFTLPAAGLVGYAIGWWLDRHFGTGHIFTIVFLMLGSAAGLVEIVRALGKS
jgi:ATP synthase protein I